MSGARAALAGLAVSLAACAPIHHTLEPYRSDSEQARVLESRAHDICVAGDGHPRTPPEKPFVTDGCSWWIDDGWAKPCCVEHDILYWCGGEYAERSHADAELRRCVDRVAPSALAWMMWTGVRMGGTPVLPTYYRWGYGRDYLPLYDDHPAECTQDDASVPAPTPDAPPPAP